MLNIICTLVTGGCPYDGDVKCNDTGRCIRSYRVCNGYSSCRYGNDEENCGKNISKFINCIMQIFCGSKSLAIQFTVKLDQFIY